MSAYIRESLGKYFDETDQTEAQSDDPIWNIVGKGSSDCGNLSTKHDLYLSASPMYTLTKETDTLEAN